MDENEFVINILKQHGIPTLTDDFIGKTVAYKYNHFLVFTDNTCVDFFESTMLTNHDDISFPAYLDLWQEKFPLEVVQIKQSIKWFKKKDLITLLENLPLESDLEEIFEIIVDKINKQQK